MPNSVKNLEYIKCYGPSNPRPAKSPAILSDTTVRRSAVDRGDLKPYLPQKHTNNNNKIQKYISIEQTKLKQNKICKNLIPDIRNTYKHIANSVQTTKIC